MYELSSLSSTAAGLGFGLLGIWMVHSLDPTFRRPWQAAIAWTAGCLVWSFGALGLTELLPQWSYQAFMLTGLIRIPIYFYLFAELSMGQTLFTYFLVDTAQLLLVLAARTASVLTAQLTGLSSDLAFLVAYVLLAASFAVWLQLWLKKYLFKALCAFGAHLNALAVFSALGYAALLFQLDAWGPWQGLSIRTGCAAVGMMAFVAAGYSVAFRTLLATMRQIEVQASTRQLNEQLALSEQYYESLVKQVEQSRMKNHDLRYHMSVLSGLCRQAQWQQLREYVESMGRELPPPMLQHYSEIGALNALLEHYAGLCQQQNIPFSCQVRLPQLATIAPMHLCVVFGNALQNAMEAMQSLETGQAPFLRVKACCAEEMLAISIENPYAGSLRWDREGNPVTQKTEPGHGLGLNSIRQTAQRYGGWCGVETRANVFTLLVTLPVAPSKSNKEVY